MFRDVTLTKPCRNLGWCIIAFRLYRLCCLCDDCGCLLVYILGLLKTYLSSFLKIRLEQAIFVKSCKIMNDCFVGSNAYG